MTEFGWDQLDRNDKALILKGMKKGRVFSGPRTMEVDWTDRCNLRCRFCSQKAMHFEDEMDLFTLERLFAQLERLGVRTLMVSGGGEPLFHRHIEVILRSVARAPFRIGTLTTNGVLMSEKLHPLLCRAVRNQITVSLNVFGAEAYADWMGVPGAVYERMLDNIRAFMKYKRVQGFDAPELIVQFLIHGANFDAMPRMLALADSLDVDGVAFNPLFGEESLNAELVRRREEFIPVAETVFHSDGRRIVRNIQTADPVLNDAVRRLQERHFPGKYAQAERRSAAFGAFRTACAMPWLGMLIKADGYVYPCCCLLNPDMRPLGNIFASPVGSIWRGAPLRRFRRRMAGLSNAVRREDAHEIEQLELPRPCKGHGLCFLKALPYLEDSAFCQEMDSWLRGGENTDIEFPERLRNSQWSFIRGRRAALWPWRCPHGPQVRVDGREVDGTVSTSGEFSFGFLPDRLPSGFHLIEVTDADGRLIKARMVEKTS